MRVNVYSEDLTHHIEVVTTRPEGESSLFYGVRFCLRSQEDAVTFWAKDMEELRRLLRRAQNAVA